MYKIKPLIYRDFIPLAEANRCGRVYPLSIAEGIQDGDIYIGAGKDCINILFCTYCGFAYLSAEADRYFMEEIHRMMQEKHQSNAGRFLLMTNEKAVEGYFASKDDIVLEKRYLFEYVGNKEYVESDIPAGCELKEIDQELLSGISGRIVPSLFWKNTESFLENGKGYCVVCGNDIASWAFSAAVSSKEIDIGIETNPTYRGNGFSILAARKMIQYTIAQGKNPVWACHYQNIASAKIAEKLGFIKNAECSIIKMRE